MTALTRRGFAVGAVAVGAVAVGVGASAEAAPFGLLEPVLRLPPGDRPSVALTLDACPGAFDERLAKALVDHAVPATVFLTTAWIRRNAKGLAFLLAHRDVFSLQNHGDRHLPPVLGQRTVYGLPVAGSLEAIKREVMNGAAAVAAASDLTPKWYRGAAALYSPEAIEPIRRLGFGIGGFSLSADLGASLPAATVVRRISGARDRDVIIGHINQPLRPSGAGIAAGVVALKQAGMDFVRLPDQIAI